MFCVTGGHFCSGTGDGETRLLVAAPLETLGE
jgi:hypothetical protein